jgi:hypothetical protein
VPCRVVSCLVVPCLAVLCRFRHASCILPCRARHWCLAVPLMSCRDVSFLDMPCCVVPYSAVLCRFCCLMSCLIVPCCIVSSLLCRLVSCHWCLAVVCHFMPYRVVMCRTVLCRIVCNFHLNLLYTAHEIIYIQYLPLPYIRCSLEPVEWMVGLLVW